MTLTDPNLKIWCDASVASNHLCDELAGQGYKVQSIFSGSSVPVAAWSSLFVYGFSDIRNTLAGTRYPPNREIRLEV
jgi:hypothetical protein